MAPEPGHMQVSCPWLVFQRRVPLDLAVSTENKVLSMVLSTVTHAVMRLLPLCTVDATQDTLTSQCLDSSYLQATR